MTINYQYTKDPYTQQINQNVIKRLPDVVFIPNNPENTDWQAYQEWIAAGNTPLPPETN